jgi:hypothetical protein
MKPANVFQLELATVFANKRGLILKLGFTSLIGFPFVFVAMPSQVKVTGLMVLVLFTSFFGAAVSFVRRQADGHLDRLKLLPIPTWSVLRDFLLSGAVVDIVQIGILLVLFVLINVSGATFGAMISIAGLFFISVLLLNFLGMVLGHVMKSNPEVHLIGALAVAFIAFISGIIPVPMLFHGFVQTVLPWNPVALLASNLTELLQGREVDKEIMVIFSSVFVGVMVIVSFLRIINWREIAAKKDKKI